VLPILLAQLFRCYKAVILMADNNGWRTIEAFKPINGGLQKGLITDKRQKLFWVQLMRERPQTSTGATTENNGLQHQQSF